MILAKINDEHKIMTDTINGITRLTACEGVDVLVLAIYFKLAGIFACFNKGSKDLATLLAKIS